MRESIISKSKSGVGAVIQKTKSDKYLLSFDPPSEMSCEIKMALDCEPYFTENEDDILLTDEFLIIYLDPLAIDIRSLFDTNGVIYNKEQYIQFEKEWGAELDDMENEMKKFAVPPRSEARENNYTRIRRSILQIATQIENVDLEDCDNADEALLDLRQKLSIVEEEIYALSNLSKSLDEDGAYDLKREAKEVGKRIKRKLDEIGHESPEDSRADLFPNGEDED
jgi:hypothetical protein